MDKTRLNETLQQLHAELESTQSVDEETREGLHHVMSDIQELLEHRGQPSAHRTLSLNERLQSALVELEVSHPNLALTLERVVDAFNEVGI